MGDASSGVSRPARHRRGPDSVEGDRFVTRNTVTGTHLGEYLGIAPTGKSVTYNEMFIVRFADGRIVETSGVVDLLAQLRQLGAIPGLSTTPNHAIIASPRKEPTMDARLNLYQNTVALKAAKYITSADHVITDAICPP